MAVALVAVVEDFWVAGGAGEAGAGEEEGSSSTKTPILNFSKREIAWSLEEKKGENDGKNTNSLNMEEKYNHNANNSREKNKNDKDWNNSNKSNHKTITIITM